MGFRAGLEVAGSMLVGIRSNADFVHHAFFPKLVLGIGSM